MGADVVFLIKIIVYCPPVVNSYYIVRALYGVPRVHYTCGFIDSRVFRYNFSRGFNYGLAMENVLRNATVHKNQPRLII